MRPFVLIRETPVGMETEKTQRPLQDTEGRRRQVRGRERGHSRAERGRWGRGRKERKLRQPSLAFKTQTGKVPPACVTPHVTAAALYTLIPLQKVL